MHDDERDNDEGVGLKRKISKSKSRSSDNLVKIAAAIKRPRKYDHLLRRNGGKRVQKLSEDVFQTGWSLLYDENISEHPDHLRELAVDIFVRLCGDIIDKATITRIVAHIQPRYLANHYHCFEHAVHVLSNCGFCLTQSRNIFTSVEKLAILYSALVHDVEHQGVPNTTLVSKHHALAKLYNDQSVAEMRSLAIGLNLLQQPGYELLSRLSEQEQTTFHEFVVELVLCTDIADMYKKQVAYLRVKDHSNEETGQLDVHSSAGRLALMTLIMRLCDVGSSMQSLRTSHYWVRNYFLEVKIASMRGDGPVFDADIFCTSQVKYIEGHSRTLIDRLRRTNCLELDFIELLTQNCANNLADWMEHGREMLCEWESDEEILSASTHPSPGKTSTHNGNGSHEEVSEGKSVAEEK